MQGAEPGEAPSTCSSHRAQLRALPRAFNVCLPYSLAFTRSESSCVNRRWASYNYLFMSNPPPCPHASLISSPSENRRFIKRGLENPVPLSFCEGCPLSGREQGPAADVGTFLDVGTSPPKGAQGQVRDRAAGGARGAPACTRLGTDMAPHG